MQGNLLLTSFLLIGLSAVGQRTVFNHQIEVPKSAKASSIESIIVPDEMTGKTTIVLHSSVQVEYLLLNNNLEIESRVRPADGLSGTIFQKGYSKYLAGVKNNKGSCFFYAIDRNHINMESVDFKNNTVINSQVIKKPDEERSIQGFTCQGRFYLICANDKKSELVIYMVDENGLSSHKSIPFDLNGFNRDKLSLSEYFSYSNVFYPRQETELIEATDLAKFYPYPGKVTIIVGNDMEPPHIWSIDLQSYSVSKKKFDLSGFSGFNGKKEKFYNNTYLYGENLYVLNVSKQKIEIGIFNFNSGQLVQKYEITESSNMQFVETPVEIRTNGRARKENIIQSNKELIKELFKGSTGIAVAHNDKGQIILTCGVYDKETGTINPGYYRGSFQQSSMPTGRVYPGSNTPVMRTFTDFNSMSNYKERSIKYTITRTVNFKITLDSSEYKLIRSDSKMSSIDKTNHYLKSMPAETEAINIFRIRGNYYLGYYSPKEKTFFVREMEK